MGIFHLDDFGLKMQAVRERKKNLGGISKLLNAVHDDKGVDDE